MGWGWSDWLCFMLLIHYKVLAHEEHLFENQITVVALYALVINSSNSGIICLGTTTLVVFYAFDSLKAQGQKIH